MSRIVFVFAFVFFPVRNDPKYQMHFFFFFLVARFSPAPADLFSRFRLRGTQEARRYITAYAWIPPELRDTCSGHSKSLNLASNRETAFRPARGNQAHENPKSFIFFIRFIFSPFFCCFVKYHTSFERLGSQGTTTALQAFLFVTATNGASAGL